MNVAWLYEARQEYLDILQFLKTQVGPKYALAFGAKVLDGIRQLAQFPESGVLQSETRMGNYGFRGLFIDHYVCIYRIERRTVYVYHLADARKNYLYPIFGLEP